MADISILSPATAAVPKKYTITGTQDILLRGVTGSFDGTGAGGSWIPAVQVVDPSGFIVGTYTASALAAGASADVSWFPGVGPTSSDTLSGAMVCCRVNIVGNQSVATGDPGQKVTWGEAPIDTGTPTPFWSATNPTRMTAPQDGNYMIFANLEWDLLGVLTNLGCYLYLNGASVPAENFLYEFNANSVPNNGTGGSFALQGGHFGIFSLLAGDYVEIVAYCNNTTGVPASLNLLDLRPTQNHYASAGMMLLTGAVGPQGQAGAGVATVTDGTHTVTAANEISFTTGATVTDAGGGLAQVAIPTPSISVVKYTTLIDYKSSVTETDLLQAAGYSIPGGTIGVNGSVLVTLIGDFLNNTGSTQNERLRVYLGATTIYDITQGVAASANRYPFSMEFLIQNLASASSQFTAGVVRGMNAAASTSGVGNALSTSQAGGGFASAGNTTVATGSAQTLRVTWTHAANSASLETRVYASLIQFY